MLFSQSLQCRYRTGRPPLLIWLSWASFAGTDGNRTAFLLLKYVLMALGLMAYFGAARIVIRDTLYAALATFALLATISMGYLTLIDKPETVLLATMLSAYMWADARVLARSGWLDHGILGVVTGLGILSGYIFLVLPVALGIGAALTPQLRARLRPLPLLAAGVIAVAIVTPFAMHAGFADTDAGSVGWIRSVSIVVLAMVTFALPAALAFALLYWRACKPLDDVQAGLEDRVWLHAYEIALIAGVLIVLCILLVADTEPFRTGGPYAALLLLPIWAFLRVKIVGATARANKIFVVLVGVFVLGVIGTRIAIYETHADNCKACREYWPMPTFADAFRQAGFQQGTILGATSDLAGNLRYHFPQSRVVTPGYAPSLFGPDPGGQCLVVWEGEKDAPKAAIDYLASALHAKVTSASMRGDITAKLINSKKRFDTMSYILLPAGVCH
jgi:hypothetical protein